MGEDQGRLEQYFSRMSELKPLPVFLYECPLAMPHHVLPDKYGRLAERHGIVGIKDTTCTRESVSDGAQGIIATTGSAAVDVLLEYWRAETRGDIAAAKQRNKGFLAGTYHPYVPVENTSEGNRPFEVLSLPTLSWDPPIPSRCKFEDA